VPIEDRKLFFIVGRCGRLANRLSLFATFIALTEELGERLINLTFHSYAHLFETTRRDILCQYPVPDQPGWVNDIPGLPPLIRKTRIATHLLQAAHRANEWLPIFPEPSVLLRQAWGQLITPLECAEVQNQIRDAQTVLISGWTFRAPEFVRRHQDKIRSYFRPIEVHAQTSRRTVEQLREQADVVIGVHIRQGDYATWRGGIYFFPTARYAAWMHELADQYSPRKVAFLVCSNEARSEKEFPGLAVRFGTGVPIADLYSLAGCDCIIGPVSSFSQWASFYGEKPLFFVTNGNAEVRRERFRVSDLGEVPH